MNELPISDIYLDGRHYDRLFDSTHDQNFWRAMAGRYGGPILELGCGTGRVTLALAEQGFLVTGLDNSQAMLSEARRKATSQGLAVDWIEGDMTNFDLGRRFPLIILPNNALGHLLNRSSFVRCLSGVHRHLKPDGRFIIDMFVPDPAKLINRPGERYAFGEYDDPDSRGRIVVNESYVYDADTQIKRVKTYHSIPGKTDVVEGILNLRMYYPQELDALITYNGFVVEHKYGDHDQKPFTSDSETQLLICRPS